MLHRCGFGQSFAFQHSLFCMGSKGISHLPTKILFFEAEYETNSVLPRLQSDNSMYLQKWSVGALG
jgi:hypothetical protein